MRARHRMQGVRFLFIFPALLIAGCHRSRSNDLTYKPVPAVRDLTTVDAPPVAQRGQKIDVPAGAIRARHCEIAFAIYHFPNGPKARVDPLTALRSIQEARRFQIVTTAPTTPNDEPTIVVRSPSIKDAPPPALSTLKYIAVGLDPAQQDDFLASTQVTTLVFHAIGPGVDAVHSDALRIVGDLAAQIGGLPVDTASRQVFSMHEWQKRADAFEHGVPIVKKHIRIAMHEEADREGGHIRIVTLGMEKIGLPDVVVNDVARDDAEPMATLITLVCQFLSEWGALKQDGQIDLALRGLRTMSARTGFHVEDGAKQRVILHLAMGDPHDGDNANRLIEIVFPGPADALQERQKRALSDLFGAHDAIADISYDAELFAASARAHAALMAMKPVWSTRIPELEQLMVKAPFETASGVNEWMWIDLARWQGTTIHGTLQNEPDDVPGLHAGARVAVEESAVLDYILTKGDGSREGNETGKRRD